jgi:FtsZ-binding cell division protein ZapB
MTQEDHDLLIELKTAFEAKISTLCNTVKELKSEIKELKEEPFVHTQQVEKCGNKFDKLDRRIDQRPKWTHITSIIVILIGLLSGIIGYNFNQDVKSDEKVDKINERVVITEQQLKIK